MTALRLLALSYLASASVFVVAATMVARPDLAREFAAGAGAMAQAVMEKLSPPPDEGPVARLDLAPAAPDAARPNHVPKAPPAAVTPPEPRKVQTEDDRFSNPDFTASVIIPILPDLSPESAPVPPEPKLVEPNTIRPNVRVGSASPPALPKMESPPPVQTRVAAATQRLKDRLTPEMMRHFSLILYV